MPLKRQRNVVGPCQQQTIEHRRALNNPYGFVAPGRHCGLCIRNIPGIVTQFESAFVYFFGGDILLDHLRDNRLQIHAILSHSSQRPHDLCIGRVYSSGSRCPIGFTVVRSLLTP